MPQAKIKQIDGLQAEIESIPAPTSLDKALTPSVTSGNYQATGIAISETPSRDSYVAVKINGNSVELGDGSRVKDCYFSGDLGNTARNIADIVAGDYLFWNGQLSGYDLDNTDEVDLYYVTATTVDTTPLPTDSFVSSSPHALVVGTRYYYVNTTSGAITLQLPAISSATRQIIFDVKLDVKGGSNNVTITANGTDTIEGAASKVIDTEKVSYTVRCPSSGTDWKFH